MKKFVLEFVRRGLMVASGGPLVLAVIYFILGETGAVASLSPTEAALGILSVTLLAFLAAGITSIYTIDRLAPAPAALIHGAVLYLGYLIMYLVNRWIPRNPMAIGIFTAVFLAAYAVIWLIIYLATKSGTDAINRKLKKAEPPAQGKNV